MMRKRQLSFTSLSSPNPLTASSNSSGRLVISGPLPLQKRTPTKERVSSVYSATSTTSSSSRYSGESYRSNASKATVKSSSSSVKNLVPILKHSASTHSSLNSVRSARPHAGRRSLPTDSRRQAIVGMPSCEPNEELDPELQSFTSFLSEHPSFVSNITPAKYDVDEPHVRRQRCVSTTTASSRNNSARASNVSYDTSSVYSRDSNFYDVKPLPPLPDNPAIRRVRNPTTPTRRVTFASDEPPGLTTNNDHPRTEMGHHIPDFDITPAIGQMVTRFRKIQNRVSSGEPVDIRILSEAFSDALGTVLDILVNIPWEVRASTSFNLAWEDLLLHQQQFYKRSSLIVTNEQLDLSNDVFRTVEQTMSSTKRLLNDVQERLDSKKTIPPLPFETEDGSEIILSPQQFHKKTPSLVSNEYMPSRSASLVGSIRGCSARTPGDNEDNLNNSRPAPIAIRIFKKSTSQLSSSSDSMSITPTSSEGRVSTLFSRKSSTASDSSIESLSREVSQYLDYSGKVEASEELAGQEPEEAGKTDYMIDDIPPARPRPKTSRVSRTVGLAVQQRILENVRASMILFPELNSDGTEFIGGIPDDEAEGDEVLYGNGQNGKFLKGLSLRRIVAQICSKNSLNDPDFTEMVLFCFRYWCKPDVFLQLLIDLYTMPALAKTDLWSTMEEKEQVQMRVLRVIKVWLTQFWRPEQDRLVFDMLMEFAQETVAPDFELTAKNIIDRLTSVCSSDAPPPLKRSQLRAETANKNFTMPFDVPRSPSTFLLRSLEDGKFDNIGPLQLHKGLGASALAQQLTVMEARLYAKLDPEEILEHYILKKEHSSDIENSNEGVPTIAARLTAHAEYTSRLTNWVSHCVLRMTEPAMRAVIFSFFINVAKKCVDLRNFSSAHSIWVGLSSYGIDRLRLTQTELSKNIQACQTFTYLAEIFDASKHFSACRALIRKSNDPAIPLIGVYRHLFNSLTETVKLFLDSNTDPDVKLINVSVCRKLSSIVQEMEATHATYKMAGNKHVLGYLEHAFKNSPTAEDLVSLCRHFRLQEEDSMRNLNKLQPSLLRPILDRLNSRRSQDD